MSYDIAIIGAGPSGATLARLLDSRYRILLLDRRDLIDRENNITKCCGGLLAPDAQRILGRMGLAVPTQVLVDPQLFLVRTIDFDNRLERYYQRFYFNMDRRRFDEWLVSIIPDNVDIAMNCRFNSLSERRDGYEFAFTYDNRIYTERVKVLVGADGAWSSVRKQLFGDDDKLRKYIAIQEWFDTNETVPHYGAIFDKKVTDFYSWTISKDGYLIIGSALEPQKDAGRKFDTLKKDLLEYGFTFSKPIKREGSYLIRPRKKDIITGNERAALVGEAAGFISPSSAEGISYALRSSLFLAESLNEGIEGFQDRYRKKSNILRNNIMYKEAKSQIMYNQHLRNIVMKSGVLSSKVLFNKGK